MGILCNHAVKPSNCSRNFVIFAVSVSLIGTKDQKKKKKIINKKGGKDRRGESLGTCSFRAGCLLEMG